MRLVGVVIGSDYPHVNFGDMLELSNTNALTFNRPGAFLCGCYSPNDVIEYQDEAGNSFQSTAARKLALVRPEHVIGRWEADGLSPIADRVFVALDQPEQPESSIIAPDPWLKRACTGMICWTGERSTMGIGTRVMVEPGTGTDLQLINGHSLLSIREKDLMLMTELGTSL